MYRVRCTISNNMSDNSDIDRFSYNSEKETLSSPFTFFYKFILPFLWFFVIGGFFLWLGFEDKETLIIFLWIYLIFGMVILAWSIPLKCVEIDYTYLYVSNYKKKIQVPLSQIEKVTDFFYWGTMLPIRVKFKKNTELGASIFFVPYGYFQLLRFLRDHPAVKMIKQRAGLRN
jgi:hypothetical protein